MDIKIIKRFLNKDVILKIIDEGEIYSRRGEIVLIIEDSFVLRFFDGRENAFHFSMIREIKEVGGGKE